MADYTVIRYGTDTSGRAILMTAYMRDVWEALLRMPEVAPFASKVVIVQGAFMSRLGGGADASAGYHDLGGCLDIRVWNLTDDEVGKFIRASRKIGFPFWLRNAAHGGMDDHAHGILGTDRPLADGAVYQWREYVAGGDGLTGSGSDYHWRPSPLVLTPPASLLEEDYMATDAAQVKLDKIIDQNEQILRMLGPEGVLRKKAKALADAVRKDTKIDRATLDAVEDFEHALDTLS